MRKLQTSSVAALAAFVLLHAGVQAAEGVGAGPLRLILPPAFYAVPDMEMAVYFDNIVLTETPEAYRFTVECDLGVVEERRWAVTPKSTDVGTHAFAVTVADAAGTVLGQAHSTLEVIPAPAGADAKTALLLVGDSLTHASLYPNELAALLSQPRSPAWEMLGTHRPESAAENVAHEGYGGWTWQRFAEKYEPNPDGTYKNRSSPFVFAGDAGQPVLDVPRYLDENFGGQRPDVITVLLGINDCFGAPPDNLAGIDARIDTMFTYADTLINAFRTAAPDAELGICITTPPNVRGAAFEANYRGKYTRWGWKRIQHRLVERELAHFGGREAENIFFIPTQLNLDPIDGYPVDNGVHPNQIGCRQIAASLYIWLKARLHDRASDRN